jgi:hypothetical protein
MGVEDPRQWPTAATMDRRGADKAVLSQSLARSRLIGPGVPISGSEPEARLRSPPQTNDDLF